ncbi:MAG: hypothetical protein KDB02_01115 [Acidimicrobiales bacterium]|nr:hypothetical protein [Acidimicrobiales bacterium]
MNTFALGRRHPRAAFRDHLDAGRQVADLLSPDWKTGTVVFALVRGGVPVAAEVAHRFAAPLDVLVARKVGVPGQPELGMGAVAEGGVVIARAGTLQRFGVDHRRFAAIARDRTAEVERMVNLFRGEREMLPVGEVDVLLVDDGLATGVTAEAAIESLRRRGARSVTLAVPVGAADTVEHLARLADDVRCVLVPQSLSSVGQWYERFDQVSDEQVISILETRRDL